MERVLSFLRQLECNNNKAQLLGATFEMLSGGPARLLLEQVEVADHLICLEERRREIIIHQEGGDNYGSINQVMLSSFSHQG